MKFSDYLIGNQWGQPMYSQVQTPIQPQQMQSIAPQQSMQSSVTDFWIKPNQSAPKKKVETFDVLWMLEKTNQFTQQAIKDNPAPVKREYSGRDKNIIEVKKWIEDSLRETHKLNTLLDMKRYVDDWATLEEIQQDFQDIPQEVIWQIYNEFSFWTKFKDILKLYPELDSIQVPQELSNKYDIRKYFNPLWEAGKTILEAKQRSKEEWSLLTSNPLTQWFMSAIWWAVKWVWDLGAWIVWLSDTINAWAKSVTQWWTIDQYKERPTTTSEDALNIFWWGTTTVWSVFALPAITLINAGIESLPEEWQRALADSMDWLWDKIAQTPWLKQWMQSLPPDRQAEFKQELANAWVWLLLWLKNKKNIVTDPKTFLKENINPIDIAKNFNENVLWVPKSAGELVEWAMNEAWNKIYTTVKWAKWKLSTMTKWVKWEVSFWDRVIAVMNGLDAETVRKFKDSPDIVKALDEWKITKESIKTDLVSAVDDVLSERNEVWSQYSEVYRNPERFDTNDIIADINSSLLEQWVKIKDNKIIWFDTTKMTWLTDQAKTALKSKYKDTIQTLAWRSDLSVKELHNIRKDLYSTSYQDGFANKKAPWVSKVSDVLNERLKNVPWFKEVDSWYKEAADLVNELKSNVLTKDWDFKGTLKALLWERWAKRMDILEKHFPWLKDKIETLAAYDDYLNTRNRKKVWLYEKAGAGAVAWFTMWWWLGAVIWAMVWPILSDFVRDPKWFKNYIVSKAWDNIANKIELWKKLNVSEKTRVNRALKEIIKNPQAALPYKWELWETTNTIIAPWKDIVTSPQGNFIKWQILDTNNSKNATANTSNIDDNSITTVKKKPVQSDTLVSKADDIKPKNILSPKSNIMENLDVLKDYKPKWYDYKIQDIDVKLTNSHKTDNYYKDLPNYWESKSVKYREQKIDNWSSVPPIVVSKTDDWFYIIDWYHRAYAQNNKWIRNIKALVIDWLWKPPYKNNDIFTKFSSSELDNLKMKTKKILAPKSDIPVIQKDLQPLYEEAKKYRSAEDMIENMVSKSDSMTQIKDPLYHVSSSEIKNLTDDKILWTTSDSDYAMKFWKRDSRILYEVNWDIKQLDTYSTQWKKIIESINQSLPKEKKFSTLFNEDWWVSSFFIQDKDVVEKLRKLWYDAVVTSESIWWSQKAIGIINPSKVKISKSTSIPKDLAPLYEEARKYKTAEEFINSNSKVYHWTNAERDVFDINKWFRQQYWKAFYWTLIKDKASNYWKVKDIYLDKDIKLFQWSNIKSSKPYIYNDSDISKYFKDNNFNSEEKISYLKSKWYDWLIAWDEHVIFNTDKIKTEAQLRKIREEANK